MNNKAQVDFGDLNWNFFWILCIFGIIVVSLMQVIWSEMGWNPGLVTKIGMFVAIPIASFVFAKIFGE